MGNNSFGKNFTITTFGESHGKGVGVVIDGCPAGLEVSIDDINSDLKMRAPGNSPFTSPRKEEDNVEILSGLFEGKTTGAPIALVIFNKDADSSKYEPIKDVLRPGHANYTYLKKYGIFDYRGGGRSSARETAARVAAGAVAKKLLKHFNIEIHAYIKSIGDIDAEIPPFHEIASLRNASPVFCPDVKGAKRMIERLTKVKEEGDSLGAIVEFMTTRLPVGLGEPIYDKLEARLAFAMLSLPATKGFEIGDGFEAARKRGSQHNDLFIAESEGTTLKSNHAGGTLGGISDGMPLIGRVAFKPTSSIQKEQASVNVKGEASPFKLPEGSRHDPCVGIRGVFVVEAMAALCLADFILSERLSRL